MMRIVATIFLSILLSACFRPSEIGDAGSVNIRLSFTPQKVTADQGSTVAVIEVDNFSGKPVKLDDVKITTSAGFDKVGAIIANSNSRFTAAIQGLTDISKSPVKVTVSIGKAVQTGYIEIIPGPANGLTLVVENEMVSADVGEVGLSVRILDEKENLSPGAVTLTTTAGVVSELVQAADGSYTARVTGLVHTVDSPVKFTATAGGVKAEAAVQILTGVLDHFEVEPIESPQVAGYLFNAEISAQDLNDNLVTAFEKTVCVRTSRGDADIGPVKFTSVLELGRSVNSFYVATPAAAPGLSLIVYDAAGCDTGIPSSAKRGQSNSFIVNTAPANDIILRSASNFNTIVAADGCTQPPPGSGEECNNDLRLATKLQILLRRYTTSVSEPENLSVLLGGRAGEIVVSMRDAAGAEFDQTPSDTEPFLGPIVEDGNTYFVKVYNLRDQGKSPYTVTARFVSLVTELDVGVVPGRLTGFSFPPIPAQRLADPTGILGNFLTSITARDSWGNQVFSYQETAPVFLQVGSGPLVSLGNSQPLLLGASIPFLVSVPPMGINPPFTARLVSDNGVVRGNSNYFRVVTTTSLITDFVVLLPGQYDGGTPNGAGVYPAPPAAGFGVCPFCTPGANATLTPDMGATSSSLVPIVQDVGVPFQILVIARSAVTAANLAIPVSFDGGVVFAGQNTGIEVLDNTCAHDTQFTAADEVTQTTLSPNFLDSQWVGTSTVIGLGSEPVCYLWVRATQANAQANLIADPFLSSSIPIGANTSSNFRVRSAPAKSLRIKNIASPVLGTGDPNVSKKLMSVTVQAYDALGNPTDNITCLSPVLTDTYGALEAAPVGYTQKSFDADGSLTLNDVWLHVNVPANSSINDSLHIDCGDGILRADSNVFQVISQGAAKFQITVTTSTIKARQTFFFTALACADADCTTLANGFNYSVSMTDTTGTLYPLKTKKFTSGVLSGQSATIDKAQDNVRIYLTGGGAKSWSAPFKVDIGQLGQFKFNMTAFPSTVVVGDTYAVAVSAADAGGNFMPNYFGRVYINNTTGKVKFDSANVTAGNYGVADVTTVTNKFYYCTNASCSAYGSQLRIVFSEMSNNDYLTISDNRGHSGFSLPHVFHAEYGPVWSFDLMGSNAEGCPSVLKQVTKVRRGFWFNVCSVAFDKYGNIKKDYNLSTPYITASPDMKPLPATVPFSQGIGRAALYLEPGSGMYIDPATAGTFSTVTYNLSVTDPNYTINSYPPLSSVITTSTVFPAEGFRTDEPFDILLEVRSQYDGSLDANFQNALIVTDTTGSIQPYCNLSASSQVQKSGTCGMRRGVELITGDLTESIGGVRRQWFTIPTMIDQNYLYVSDGFGRFPTLRMGPFRVLGDLTSFTISPISANIPADYPVSITITAYNSLGNVMTGFNAPVLLSNARNSINPIGDHTGPIALPANFVNGSMVTSFRVYNANALSDKLTVSYAGISDESNSFVAAPRALTSLYFYPIGSQPGYVDFTTHIEARDQFGSKYLLNGTIALSLDITGNTGTWTVRPSSVSMANGDTVATVAIDGGITAQPIRLRASSGAVVNQYSNAFTIDASTIANFNVAFVPPIASPKAGCPYNVRITARDGANATIEGFSGTVNLSWSNASTAGMSPLVTPAFVDGIANVSVTMTSQPFGLPAGIQARFSLANPIAGQTPNFTLAAAGACP